METLVLPCAFFCRRRQLYERRRHLCKRRRRLCKRRRRQNFLPVQTEVFACMIGRIQAGGWKFMERKTGDVSLRLKLIVTFAVVES